MPMSMSLVSPMMVMMTNKKSHRKRTCQTNTEPKKQQEKAEKKNRQPNGIYNAWCIRQNLF